MKNTLFILTSICFLFGTVSNAQEQGVATYSVSVVENEDDIIQQQMKTAILDILDYVDDLSFQLYFKNTKSYFSLEDKLYRSEIIADAASLIAHYANPIVKVANKAYYQNSRNSFENSNKWVSSEIKDNWEITQETKEINNYTVYKANGIYEKGNSTVGYKKMKATAWFCPEIPLPHGPLDFAGLPGLIFELSFENVTYGLEKIEFRDVKLPKVDFDHVITVEQDEQDTKESMGR